MVLSEERIKAQTRRLLLSRTRILCGHGFYGLLLMHMKFELNEGFPTAATDTKRMIFNPDFLDKLSDSELDIIMMHEILHVVLGHCRRGASSSRFTYDRYNIASDIVVNSNILYAKNMNRQAITTRCLGELMHLAPDGKEGYEYTAEQVYDMLPPEWPQQRKKPKASGSEEGKRKEGKRPGSVQLGRAQKVQASKHNNTTWDDHTHWGDYEDDETLRDVWVKRFEDACKAVEIRDPSNARGILPLFAQRYLQKLRQPQTNWRTKLNDFVQEEVVDFSFVYLDRRFQDSPFFLPGFNDKDFHPADILFMIDTSASMSDAMITAAYTEIKGAIDQFDGNLTGWLGFFDAAIIEPKPFADKDEFRTIRPAGGGGTDFQIIFEYVLYHMADHPPASMIILTDGFAPFPQEEIAGGIPVLWLLNNEDVEPPWGQVARITVPASERQGSSG